MARSKRTNHAQVKVWTERSISTLEGPIAGVAIDLLICAAPADRDAAIAKLHAAFIQPAETPAAPPIGKQFAKLFQFESVGQVLVMLDSGDEGPEIRFHFYPKNLGVCAVTLGFNGEAAWDNAEKAFTNVDAAHAEKIVSKALETMPAGLNDD